MLDPRNRQLLLEGLRPPDGYHFDEAIGTSYSLDLLALLTTPLAFTFFDWEDEDGRPTADPFALLESLRRHANRMHLYCQAGEIKLPPPSQRLVAYLEKSVISVNAPTRGGIFHPKVWIVRYTAEDKPVAYKVICLTRNLTFDRSWDTVLVLDGQVLDRKNAIRAMHPLADFVEALPAMAVDPMPTLQERASRFSGELRRLQIDPPEGVEEVAFWPLGIAGYKKSPLQSIKADGAVLAMAPFLSPGVLSRLQNRRSQNILVSRPDELEKVSPDVLAGFKEIYYLSSTADDPEDDREEEARTSLAGLHAKLFIVEAGWDSHVLTGSANATEAAFSRNVEFVVELIGKKSKLGIQKFLGQEDKKEGMRALLVPWTVKSCDLSEEEAIREKLESKLTELRRAIAAIPMLLKCRVSAADPKAFDMELHGSRPLPEFSGVRVLCWPSSLRREAGVSPATNKGMFARFGPIALDSLSGFVAFELEVTEASVSCSSRFIVNVPLEGAPEDRIERLLASQLKDTDQLLKLLLLLLEAGSISADWSLRLGASGDNEHATVWSDGTPLFERMVQALVDSKRSVLEVGSLIEELARTEDGRAVIPPQLWRLWSEIKACVGEPHERT